jgi:membrane protein DedA with SNARE-associated domain
MTNWISGIIKSIGDPAIAALMFVENAFPPLPSKLIMPFAGYMVPSIGAFSFVGVVIADATGSVLGALSLYFLGRLASRQQLKS